MMRGWHVRTFCGACWWSLRSWRQYWNHKVPGPSSYSFGPIFFYRED